MLRRNLLILLVLWLMLLSAVSACTRQRQPWPEKIPFDLPLPTVHAALPSPTPSGPLMPRYTPHVTSPPPTAIVTPAPPGTNPSPETTQSPPSQATPYPFSATYIVQPGDTLYDIAVKFNVSLQQLAKINNISDPTTIETGQQLLIP